ncbi:MAG TPA: polymer-forming cytoskeletal protein [Bacteroidia bacterium]|nr:polymer-forming cytoskeletal protein [Bacteroidia bacterium]
MFGIRQRNKTSKFTCPRCGHLQEEPALLVSSFCRACGEHFRVRKGVAQGYPGLRVSGITEVVPYRPAKRETEETPESVDPGEEFGPPPETLDQTLSAGAFFGLVDPPVEEETSPEEQAIGIKAQSRKTLGEGSIAALIGSTQPDKMPHDYVAPGSRGARDEPALDQPVRCFRCHHVQQVSRFAKSTQCERCNLYISLADYEIKRVKSHTLQTRGNISISRRGGLVGDSQIACHNLTVNGAIDATVDCSGDAVFRHSGTVRGKLNCVHLVVEKHCEVRFPDGAMVTRADIAGRFVGQLTCSGNVRIARTGSVEGDLAAVELDLREGGRVTGETRLAAEISTDLPFRKSFDPTVIG